MNELQPLLDLLGGKAGWLPTALTWLAAIKLASTLVENKLNHWLCDQLNQIAASEGGDDDAYLRALFSRSWYKLGSFLLRFTGLRLPTLADLERAIQHQAEAVKGGTQELRKSSGALVPAVLLVALLALAGCASLQRDPATARRIADHAAYDVTLILLEQHPEWRASFAQAAADLRFLEKQPQFDTIAVIEILQRLPVKELKSANARVAFDAGLLVVELAGNPRLEPQAQENLRVAIAGLADGLERRLAEPAEPRP